MKNILARLTVFSLVLIPFLACSHGRSDLLGEDDTAGGLDLPGNRQWSGSPVVQTEVLKVFDLVSSEAYTAVQATADALERKQNPKISQWRTLGDYNGHAITSGSSAFIQDRYIFDYDLKTTFTAFSIFGRLLLDGDLSMNFRLMPLNGKWTYGDLTIDGKVGFRGDWKGEVQYVSVHIPVDSLGKLIPSVIFNAQVDTLPIEFYPPGLVVLWSGDSRFKFYPYN